MLSPETAFYLPRRFAARLPDLALLRHSLYPLSVRGDLSDVILVVPDGPLDLTFSLVCELSALLGRLAPGDRVALRVRRASELNAVERASSHLVVLEPTQVRPLVPAPALDWRRLPAGPSLRQAPMLQELVSPWNPRRFVLSLRAPSTALAPALRRLGDPGALARLAGDTAFLTADGAVCYRVGREQSFDEVSYGTAIEAWLQTYWLALPLLVAAVSTPLFFAIRGALQQYGAAHLTSSNGPS